MKDLNATNTHPDITFSTVTVDDTSVRYLQRDGATDTPPLLIFNGLGQSLEVLLPLIDELKDRTIVAFDMPGIGRTPMLEDIATVADYAEFTLRLLDKLKIENVDVLGISWGGAVAQHLARDASSRVGKLVLAITSAGGIGSWWGTPIALSEIMFPMRYISKTYGNFIGPLMYGGEAIFAPDDFREYSKHAIAPSPEGYFTQVRAMCNWTSLPWLRQLPQKALIIAGKYDGLIPITNQILLANMMQNARLEVYPAGHLLMYTQRKDVGVTIGAFLDG
ncbi:alpha/beta hydrolase [Aliiroseovarius sp. F47248L]|uniref:alpha/beta fold hydrolase n=1 Tax=Aliiroseovarius sp. F47248L TaxID=2926420 RepID=UPI001FF5BA05|nr:alpha/beta hydrolase [Aliiroseovarius sp. F47248L]MCK0140060.1 alpha/beta hydrolase [Aliiroseovarius sp. F47248L]